METGETVENVTFISELNPPFFSIVTWRLRGYNIRGLSLLFPTVLCKNHGQHLGVSVITHVLGPDP